MVFVRDWWEYLSGVPNHTVYLLLRDFFIINQTSLDTILG